MVELMMVMTLLVLFGVTSYTMIYAGANTQERIISEKDAQTDARIALSYINVRLRQNDSKDKIDVVNLPLTGENAIVIKERTVDAQYDTWIFWIDGQIMECLVDPGAEPEEINSFYIVDAEKLDIAFDDEENAITSTVYYYYGRALHEMSQTVYLRSGKM